MLRKIAFGLVATLVGFGVNAEFAQAQDPFAFQFGYSLGFQNSFRNRMPAPPYFSVHPPVYYGQRYSRPYGESPYASWPLLRSAPSYHVVPSEGHFVTPRVIENPYVQGHPNDTPRIKIGDEAGTRPIASSQVQKPAVVIHNPFAFEQYAKK